VRRCSASKRIHSRKRTKRYFGPPGVFVVETKNVAGKVRISGSEVRIGGRHIPRRGAVLADGDSGIS
jgi:ribosomal protein L28